MSLRPIPAHLIEAVAAEEGRRMPPGSGVALAIIGSTLFWGGLGLGVLVHWFA